MRDYQFGKTIHFGSLTRNIIGYMHQKNHWLIPLILLGTAGSVISTYYPVTFQRTIVSQLVTQTDYLVLFRSVLVYFLVMVTASSILALAHGYCNSRFSLIRLDFMADVNRKYLEMDYKYFEDASFAGEIQNAMQSTQGNDMGFEYFMHMVFKLPAAVISIIILSTLIGSYVPIVLLGLLINVTVIFLVKNSVKKMEYRHREESMVVRRKIGYYSTKTGDFSFGKDIRIFGLRKLLIQGFQREIEQLMALVRLFKLREYKLGLFSVLTLTLSDILIFGSLLLLARNGLAIADFTMLLTASVSLSLLLKTTIEEVAKLVGELRYIQGAYDFLEADLNDNTGLIEQVPHGPLTIEFSNVSFAYPGTDTDVLRDISFSISPSEKLAIVGINGAGKSTLIKLLSGLYRPDQGDILINGVSHSAYTKKALFTMFSCVFQDISIFPFDIRTNVTLSSNDTANDIEIWKAIERAGLKEKIEGLTDGLDQKLNRVVYDDGINLSGGENQKLAIARALYKDTHMVILDEPTAALDALAEQAIYAQFNQLIGDNTAIYISHRLASTQFCDRIILLDQSGIREMGTHQELLAQKGEYHRMFRLQGKYYQEEANYVQA